MKIAPLDMRQQRFRTAFRGYDRIEVVAFLTEAADDYEHALREIDQLRQDLSRLEALLTEHRERETNLRNTLLTAQRLADEIREQAQQEANLIVREADGRADLLIEKTRVRLEEIENQINEMRMRRRDTENSLEGAILSLQNALEFVRSGDRQDRDEKILLHRPRQADGAAGAQRPAEDPPASDRKAHGQS